jgi:hypothetical protein
VVKAYDVQEVGDGARVVDCHTVAHQDHGVQVVVVVHLDPDVFPNRFEQLIPFNQH